MRMILILTITLIASCSTTKLVNVHKELEFNVEQCAPRLSSDLKRKVIALPLEQKKLFVEAADFYRAKITTLCNLTNAHNEAHKD